MLLAASFLERNSWVPGVVVAVVLFIIGTGITLYLRQRDKDAKHLDYRVTSDLPIVVNRPEDTDLKVTYFDEEIHNPRIVRVRFTNTGKRVIKGEDFLEEYTIHVSNVKLLDATIVDASANNLVPILAIDPNESGQTVELNINTLNASDTFTVQLVVDGENATEVEVSGRIEGQTRPPQVYEEREPIPTSRKVTLALYAIITLTLVMLGAYRFLHEQPSERVVQSAFVLVGFIIALGGTILGYIVGAESHKG